MSDELKHCPTCRCFASDRPAENGQPLAFIDSQGLPRYSSRFRFNAFGTAADAYASHAPQRTRGATTYVWRLPDGLYDATVTENPVGMPWYPAEAVPFSQLGGPGD